MHAMVKLFGLQLHYFAGKDPLRYRLARYSGYLKVIACLPVIICSTMTQSGNAYAERPDPRSSVHFYIETYGIVEPEDVPLVARAHQIFAQVHAVADKKTGHSPQLKVLNSEGSPWALALPDGYIILSRKALEICYRDVSKRAGDARVAFILGHELAHMSNNDFWHRDVYMSLAGEPGDQQMQKLKRLIQTSEGLSGNNTEWNWQLVAQRRELEADDVGFVYATIAGFNTDHLLASPDKSTDFLNYWVEQTRAHIDQQHLGPDDRSRFLRTRLKLLREKTEIFHYGVRLVHFGRYRDALFFFEEFLSVFPSREVLNNLGYCHLQLARELMGEKQAYKYWFPTLLEVSTRGFQAVKSVENATETTAAVKQHLNTAADYLQRAREADPVFLPARVNLAVTYAYLGKYHEARSAIEHARQLAPEDLGVRSLRALILYWQEKDIDMWPTAVKILQNIAREDKVPSHVLYNLARLLEERGRHGQANVYWERLAQSRDELPHYQYIVVCDKTNKKGYCTEVTGKQASDLSKCLSNVKQAVHPGVALDRNFIARHLQDWNQILLERGPYRAQIFRHPSGKSLLAFDQVIDMIVVQAPDALHLQCPQPRKKHTLSHGQIWSYGKQWAAFFDKADRSELWVARP